MDLDALTSVRRGEWDRLDELSRQRTLSGSEVDELVQRYRSASADLSDMKSSVGRTHASESLSTSLMRARLRLTGARPNPLKALQQLFVQQIPAALYSVRWTTLAIAIIFIGITSLVAFWIDSDPRLIESLGNRAELQAYADNDFTEYYNPAAAFAGQVWTNNAWLTAQCVLFGATGLYPAFLLISNAASLGTSAAVLMHFDKGDVFLLHILPHGLLEMTCIFVAGAAGLHVFWSWVAPGRRTRGESFAQAGRSLATVAIGLVLALALSGVVEGFVTGQSTWPWTIKIGIGVLALGAFLSYMLILGRWATKHGETGDLTEYESGTPTLIGG